MQSAMGVMWGVESCAFGDTCMSGSDGGCLGGKSWHEVMTCGMKADASASDAERCGICLLLLRCWKTRELCNQELNCVRCVELQATTS